jgi:thiamine-monophosphate kinase
MSAGISDIAAMGSTPKFCLVSLFIPKKAGSQNWINGINQGIKEASNYYDVTIIGGNITKSQRYAVDIFAIGDVDPSQVLQKKGAHIGDGVFVTGYLGDAHTGWELLQNPSTKLSQTHIQYLKTHHFKPYAKVKEALVLANLGYITAMTDMSDGLATDLLHLCKASNVGVTIDEKRIPISPAVSAYAKVTQKDPLLLALEGGEDFALCFTAPLHYEKQIIQAVKEKTKTTIYRIGTICSKNQGKTLRLKNGKKRTLTALGFDNLA